MSLSSILDRVIPAAVGYATGGPAGAFVATVGTEQAKSQQKKIETQNAILAKERESRMAEIFSGSNLSSVQPSVNLNPQPTGFFDRLSNFGSRIGTGTLNVLENVLPGVITGKILGQQPGRANQGPAVSTTLNLGAQESAGSGSIQAGFGTALAPLANVASRLLKSPAGQVGLGTGIGGALSLFSSDGRQMRITRKMKSQARMVLNLTGGNISAAADILGVDDNTLVMILLKRFRNDGPVITKAALRKTRQTMRRLKSMCDMQSDLLPRTTRRRAPMKRATTTTLIKN